jgi:hypothetical protein
MIHIRVIYKNFFGTCAWTTWVKEDEINDKLASKDIPKDAKVWIDRGTQYDRYLGYEHAA